MRALLLSFALVGCSSPLDNALYDVDLRYSQPGGERETPAFLAELNLESRECISTEALEGSRLGELSPSFVLQRPDEGAGWDLSEFGLFYEGDGCQSWVVVGFEDVSTLADAETVSLSLATDQETYALELGNHPFAARTLTPDAALSAETLLGSTVTLAMDGPGALYADAEPQLHISWADGAASDYAVLPMDNDGTSLSYRFPEDLFDIGSFGAYEDTSTADEFTLENITVDLAWPMLLDGTPAVYRPRVVNGLDFWAIGYPDPILAL